MRNAADCSWNSIIVAGLLRQGRWLGAMSIGLSLISMLPILLAASVGRPVLAIPSILSLAAGCIALWLTMRVDFDAGLFAAISRNGNLDTFDDAMTTLGLMPSTRRGRSLDERIAGALKLLKQLIITLSVQILLLLAGICLLQGWKVS